MPRIALPSASLCRREHPDEEGTETRRPEDDLPVPLQRRREHPDEEGTETPAEQARVQASLRGRREHPDEEGTETGGGGKDGRSAPPTAAESTPMKRGLKQAEAVVKARFYIAAAESTPMKRGLKPDPARAGESL